MKKKRLENSSSKYNLDFIKIYLGIQWETAGWGKITGIEVNGFLQGAIAKLVVKQHRTSWYAEFLENVALLNAGLFNVLFIGLNF